MDILKIYQYIEMAGVFTLGITILATIVVRITPSKKDDARMNKIRAVLDRVLIMLPTFGTNPKTKKLMQINDKLDAL